MNRAELAKLVAAALGRTTSPPKAWPVPQLVKRAAQEGVSSLALAGARRLNLAVPPEDEAAMRCEARAAAARALVLLEGARAIGEAFAAQNIDAILFRGVALIAANVTAPEERPCGDVDLIVRPGAIEKAGRLLCDELGFKPVYGTDRTFARGAVHIDLHAKSSDLVLPIDLPESRSPVRLDIDALFARARSSPARGFLALDPESHLVLLAAHAYLVHTFERLAMLVDLARLSHAPGFDWTRCAGFACEANLTQPVAFALLATERLGLAEFSDALERPRLRGIEGHLFARTLAGRARRDDRYLLAVASRSFPLGYRLRVALRALVPPRRALRREGEPVEKVGLRRYLVHWMRLPRKALFR